LVVLAVGLALFIPAARKRAHALSRERAAAAWVAKVHEHRVQASARGATLRADLGRTQGRITQLQHEQASGFSSAIEIGQARGKSAGSLAGTRAGTTAGHRERSSMSTPGWYFVHVAWSGGLPMIDSSYTLPPGPGHAYSIENGKAYNRDTTTG
jgi:hypothetical protein